MHLVKESIIALFLFIVAITWFGCDQAAAKGAVVTMDGETYSAEEVRNWWRNWRDEGMSVPETPDPFIDWLLFVHEAENMALADDARYQHEANVYLKVVSLVSLKNEEIDRKIDFSEEKLWGYYQEQFSPQWLLNILIYKDLESAEKGYAELESGKVSVADLAKIAGERAKQELANNPHGDRTIDVAELKKLSGDEEQLLGVHEKVVKMPFTTEKSWRDVIAGLSKGSFSRPFAWQESYVILHLADAVPGGKEDFAKKQGEVRNRYRKYQEAVLTNDLVEGLKKKYGVQIDEERISKLDPNKPAAEFADVPVITLGTMTVTEKQLAEKVRQELEFNKQYGFKAEEIGPMVRRVVGGIVSQTLTTMESLDRHYEQKSPTRELFEFYKRNKMVKYLEAQIQSQGKDIPEQEITAYYQEHLADFTTPQVYRMAVIEGAEEELKKIWLEVVVNKKDVMVVTEERLGHKPEVASYPANHMAPEIVERAAVLAKGDLSQVFPSGKGFAMLYMAEAIPSRTAPLANVKEMIAKKLRQERFDEAKNSYLSALREKTAIEVNDKAWRKLREELVKESEKK